MSLFSVDASSAAEGQAKGKLDSRARFPRGMGYLMFVSGVPSRHSVRGAVRWFAVLAAVIAAAVVGSSLSPAMAVDPVPEMGALVGTVTAHAGAAIDANADVQVEVATATGEFGTSYVHGTGAQAGTFRVEGPAGAVISSVHFYDNNGYYLDKVLDGLSLAIATGDTTLAPTALQPAGWLVGSVTGSGGAPVEATAGISVTAFDGDNRRVASGRVETSGELASKYVVRGVPDGTTIARLVFYVDSGSYRGATVDLPEPRPIVGGGNHVAGPSVVLGQPGAITGRVSAGGSGLANATVTVTDPDGNVVATGRTSRATGHIGEFSIRREAGSYKLKVAARGYASTWFGGPAPTDASLIAHADADSPIGDISLTAGGASSLGKVAGERLGYCDDVVLPRNDDSSSPRVDLPFRPKFFGREYPSLFVNNNGNVTFDHPESEYTPSAITANTSNAMIAPFFADVDTRGRDSWEVTYGSSPDNKTFCVLWGDVGYFDGHDDKLNGFQLLLTNRSGDPGRSPGDFDIRVNYDQIAWETGDASGGANGFGGTSAVAGFSAGTGDAGTFMQLSGSLVNGALLDSGPDTSALVKNRLNSAQLGRYAWEVRNEGVAADFGSLKGRVVTNSPAPATPVGGAWVQACRNESQCSYSQTSSDGGFNIPGVRTGDYAITATPPGSGLFPGSASATVTAGTTTGVPDIVLAAPAPLPSNTTVGGIGTGENGEPVLHWSLPTDLDVSAGCSGAGNGTYKVTVDGRTVREGALAEGPAGHYRATIEPLYPVHGAGQVTTHVPCPGGATDGSFSIYIDPSGQVVDQYGTPLAGATATLLRAESVDGPFTLVADGSDVMSAGNRANPSTTGSTGTFAWDVIPGWYEVSATKAGCLTATTDPMQVPPPRTGVVLKLVCTPGSQPAPSAAPTFSGSLTVGSTVSVTAGTWPDGVAVQGYQWLRDGIAIPGETSASHTISADDAGKALAVQVTAQRAGFESFSSVFSAGTVAIPQTQPATQAPPVIQDQHVAGRVPAKLKRNTRKLVKLPTTTDGGQRVSWVSATPKICKVVRGKLKLTGKRGTCRLVGAAPQAGNFRGLRQVYGIRVK